MVGVWLGILVTCLPTSRKPAPALDTSIRHKASLHLGLADKVDIKDLKRQEEKHMKEQQCC